MHISGETVHIVIAESSLIVRGGLSAALEKITTVNTHIVEVTSIEGLHECMEAHSPDILVVNPMFEGKFSLAHMKASYPSVKYVALLTGYMDGNLLEEYDSTLSIYDNLERIDILFAKLSGVVSDEEPKVGEDNEMKGGYDGDAMQADGLSQREKEIVVCVVRGLTNKEIADKLFLSVHTVITHRRNIARKLQIHSAAALTIYAIANKLIELKDLK